LELLGLWHLRNQQLVHSCCVNRKSNFRIVIEDELLLLLLLLLSLRSQNEQC
jgi:hypothetical protein